MGTLSTPDGSITVPVACPISLSWEQWLEKDRSLDTRRTGAGGLWEKVALGLLSSSVNVIGKEKRPC